ncbi:hypothetical protein NDU88_000220 [Pleurodeles waltl]|uniref:Uncharacterized protein n=1 Tax=Pleurodeles waltl TaxID=8319 RepID=A0AAV7KSX7_PLEWA|nr:hypothetical protein NDU88_000220 [Pleurodeles waltl]
MEASVVVRFPPWICLAYTFILGAIALFLSLQVGRFLWLRWSLCAEQEHMEGHGRRASPERDPELENEEQFLRDIHEILRVVRDEIQEVLSQMERCKHCHERDTPYDNRPVLRRSCSLGPYPTHAKVRSQLCSCCAEKLNAGAQE